MRKLPALAIALLLLVPSPAFALGGFGPNGGGSGGGTIPGAVCGDSGHALAWDGSAYYCQAITGVAAAGGTNGQVQYNNAGGLGGFTTSGDATINTATGALTLATVNANVGTFGSATSCDTQTVNAKGLITAISSATCTPAWTSITSTPTTIGGYGITDGLTTALANTKILIGGAGGLAAAQTMSQDCTLGNTGVITCTKTNNVSFAASATTDTTSASNIGSGTLALARFPTLAADSFWLNATGSAAIPTAVALPSCSTASSALTYDTTAHALGCNSITGGGGGTPGGTSGQIQYNNAGAFGGFTMSQDCTITTGGVITCTKTNNVAYAASATTDTTSASNISSGTLGLARFPTLAADSFWLNATGSAAVPTAVALPSCSTGSSALTYNTTSHALGCNTISGGSLAYTATFSGAASGTPGATGLGLVLAAATFTDNNTAVSGTAALFAAHSIAVPTLAATNATVTTTHATSLYIADVPTTGTNETITAKSAVYLNAGDFNLGSNASKIRQWNVGTPGVTNRETFEWGWISSVYTGLFAKNGTGSAESFAIDMTTAGGGIQLKVGSGQSIGFVANGTTQATIGNTVFNSNSGSGVALALNTAASATVPTLVPNRASSTTGIGAQASGNISMITAGTERFRFSATGPTAITMPTDATKTDASVCRDTTTGDLYTGTGTLGICLGTSSARYKSGIQDLDVGLNEILKLTPRMFFYKDASVGDPNKTMYGFIAEESTFLPMLIGFDDQGQPNTFDYMGLVPILVKAIQQQQAQINDLQARLATIEKRLGP